MQAIRTNNTTMPNNSNGRFIAFVIIFSILIIATLYTDISMAFRTSAQPKGTIVISQKSLEEKYGLRVNLVAVTAAGGLVDVRLKIVDGEKLKLLLTDKKNFPVLYTKQGVILNAPEEIKSQEIQFITGGNLFIIYPNSGNTIKKDTPVTILFGDIAVEPINAK